MKMLISLLGNQSDAPGQPPSSEEEGRQAKGKYGQAIIVTKILILDFSQMLSKMPSCGRGSCGSQKASKVHFN